MCSLNSVKQHSTKSLTSNNNVYNLSTSNMSTANTNPGNFANRPKEEVQEIASKGGQSSAGGFASMDPDKQVCQARLMLPKLSYHPSPLEPKMEHAKWDFSAKSVRKEARHPAGHSNPVVRRLERRVEREGPHKHWLHVNPL